MKVIRALTKYELLELIRGKILWVILLLYIFGFQQSISSMYIAGEFKIGFVSILKSSWLPLNLIMFPMLIIAFKIGNSEDEIFNSMNISRREKLLGKLNPLLIINLIILLIGIVVYISVAILCNVSFEYFLYLFKGYLINTVIFLSVTSLLGLLIGQYIPKKIGQIPSYFIMLFSFLFLCNFYKEGNGILPLFKMNTFPSTFEIFSYDNIYFIYIFFWVMVLCLGTILLYKNEDINLWIKRKIPVVSIFIIVICIGVFTVVVKNKPVFYDLVANENGYKLEENYNNTYYAEENRGYYISEYNMNIKMDKNIQNECEMIVNIDESNIKELEFALFKEIEIYNVNIDGNNVDYERKGNYVKIKLLDKVEKNTVIKVKISYEGKVNTMWYQSREMFFIRKNSMFLADAFEWYPKLNDGRLKKYNVLIDYNSSNKIYSNLSEKSKNLFYGEDKEIFLISGNLKEVEYKGYRIVANEEYIKTDLQLENTIESFKNIKINHKLDEYEVNQIIYTPNLPGKIFTPYKGTYLNTGSDFDTFISNK